MEKIQWWRKSTAYQIYPKSFCDSNGDGIGDLRGIIQKLDYLKELGIDLLYINPIFASPMKDNGYDVSDYYLVNPIFGTNEDLYELLEKARIRDIKIMLDMVLNHCSTEHEWFKKALEDPEGEYGKFFYIKKGKENLPPNNWRSIFGGSAWEKIPDTDYYYLHIFMKEQADLNWDNPVLREKMYQMVNFWIEKGASGIRLDATAYMKKKEGLPSFEADAADGMVSIKHGTLNQPGLEVYLQELKEKTYGQRDCFIVGELEDADVSKIHDYISLQNGYFDAIFEVAHMSLGQKAPNYFWCEQQEWQAKELKERIFASQEKLCPHLWIANLIENHDMPRSTEWLLPKEGRNYYGMSMLACFYMFLWGTPFIYQGQEIGMKNFPFDSIEQYNDCSSLNQYKIALSKGYSEKEALEFVHAKSRDNARYPMLWDNTEKAGFTSGRPWLPIPCSNERTSVAEQQKNPYSLFNFYRKIIALRKKQGYSELFAAGLFEPIDINDKRIIAYSRTNSERKILIICNYSPEECLLCFESDMEILLNNYEMLLLDENNIVLQPYQAILCDVPF